MEAGARLRDPELVRFHPSGIIEPENAAGTLVSEAARGEGGILRTALGERTAPPPPMSGDPGPLRVWPSGQPAARAASRTIRATSCGRETPTACDARTSTVRASARSGM